MAKLVSWQVGKELDPRLQMKSGPCQPCHLAYLKGQASILINYLLNIHFLYSHRV